MVDRIDRDRDRVTMYASDQWASLSVSISAIVCLMLDERHFTHDCSVPASRESKVMIIDDCHVMIMTIAIYVHSQLPDATGSSACYLSPSLISEECRARKPPQCYCTRRPHDRMINVQCDVNVFRVLLHEFEVHIG